ncbi:MAG TPA: UPF0175 family protein [Thermoanaerobaculia bacterium]|nr:UPF0175 family protein [Thermoanaerobaculia bacterium]
MKIKEKPGASRVFQPGLCGNNLLRGSGRAVGQQEPGRKGGKLSRMAGLKVEIELPRNLLAALDIQESELGRLAKEWVLLELFQEGKISAGKAAEVLSLSKAQFIELLNQRNLPYLDADREELEREVAAARAASKPYRP